MAAKHTSVPSRPTPVSPFRNSLVGILSLAVVSGLALPAVGQSLAFTKSPAPNQKIQSTSTSWTTVVSQSFTGTAGRNLVASSFSMYSPTFYTIGQFRLRCTSGCDTTLFPTGEASPPITLSIPYQTSNANPTNNGGISYIFTQVTGAATYVLEHRLEETQAGKNFQTADWTIAVVSLTMSGGTQLATGQDKFGLLGSNDGTSDITASTVAFAAGSHGVTLTNLVRGTGGSAATATATTATAHGFVGGDRILVTGITNDPANWVGFFVVSTTPTLTTFTFTLGVTTATTPAVGNMRALRLPSSLTGSGTTATMTLSGHTFATGDLILVSGASPFSYNGLAAVTGTSGNTFTYSTTAPVGASPATGNITAIRAMRAVGSLTHQGSGVARVTLANHGFQVGDRVYVKGARATAAQLQLMPSLLPPYDSDLYNGYFTITAADASLNTWFEYQMDGSPSASPATGSIVVGRTARALTAPGITQASSVVTATQTGHGFNVGDRVVVGGTGFDQYNGDYGVSAINFTAGTPATTFSYSATGGGLTTTNGWARLGAVRVSTLRQTGNTVQGRALAPHGLRVGDKVEIAGVKPPKPTTNEFLYYQGDFIVTSVPDALTFQYVQPDITGLPTLTWAAGADELSARFISPNLDDGTFLAKRPGAPNAAPVPLQVEVSIPNTANVIRDVVYSFYASLKQRTAGSLASAAQWRYGNFQVYYQSPSMRATDSWLPINMQYQKTVDAVTPASGFTTPESGFVQLFQRFRATEGGPHRFRVKTEQRHGGDGLIAEAGSLFALSTAWDGGYFRTLYATGRGYNKAANNTQWIDESDQPFNRFATEPFTKTGTSSFVALASSNTWATKGGGTALVELTPGMRNAGWASKQTGQDAWGSTINSPNVVFMSRLYNGTNGDLCLNKGFLGGRMPGTAIGGCEAASQTAIGVAVHPLNPLSGSLMPPWEGSATSAMTGQQGAVNADLVIFATEGDVPTWAAIDSFRDASAGGPTTVSWRTSAELGTATFRLERRDAEGGPWKAVRTGAIPALPPSPAGATYQVEDPDAEPGGEYEYRLVEEEATGNVVAYEANRVKFVNAKRSSAASASFVRTPNASSEPPVKRPHPSAANLPRALSSWKAFVPEDGIYAIPATPSSVIGTSRNHRITNLGQEVAFANDAKAGRLIFFGQGLNNLHTDRNAYIIRPGAPRYMNEVNGKAPAAGAQPASFMATAHFERDLVPGIGWVYEADQDFWFWRAFMAESPSVRSAELPIDLPLVDTAGGSATITFRIHGASDSPAPFDYHLRASLNGASAGSVRLGGSGPIEGSITFDASLLQPGGNVLRLEALLDPGLSRSWFYLNGIDVRYPKLFQASGNEARVRAVAGQKTVTVSGFTTADILVFDVTTPRSPAWIKAVGVAGTGKTGPYSATFAVPSGAAEFLVLGEDRVRTTNVEALVEAGLATRTAGAAHLVVAPHDLIEPARALAAYRSSQGLASEAIPLEAVWDEFGHGLPSPAALQAFFATATSRWSPAPKYAVLAGRGTYDERNLLGHNDNFIPTFFVPTPRGLVGNDGPYEGASSLVVGRIPVTSAEALRAHVEKIARHESAASRRSVTVGADNPDGGGDFYTAADQVGSMVPESFDLHTAYLGRQPLSEVRRRVFEAFGRGDDFLAWVGHSGSDRLANENVINVSDVASLPTADRLPVLVGATCIANTFHFAGFQSIGERLANRAAGGTAASWAPVGAAFNAASSVVVRTFFEQAFAGQGPRPRLGDVVRATIDTLPQDVYDTEALSLYQVLGDPACFLP